MDSIDQYSLVLCVYNTDVAEIIDGQYLKGFLLSQRRKNIQQVKFSFGKSQCNSNLYMTVKKGLITWLAL